MKKSVVVRAAVSLALIAFVEAKWNSIAAQSAQAAPSSRAVVSPNAKVRGATSRMVALIAKGAERSKTFKQLLDRINATDGIVYVVEGTCQEAVEACLLFSITATETNRILWIRVDPSRADVRVIGSVAHELQHAFEVLSVRSIRTDTAMALLYRRIGHLVRRRFETDAAIEVGATVRAEVRERKRTDDGQQPC